MIEMRSVPSFDIEEVWPLMENYVANVVVDHSHGTLTTDSILESIKNREMQAMVAAEDDKVYGVLITETIVAGSGIKHIHVVAVAGDRFDEWLEKGNELLKGWAKSLDASFISTNGRKGLLRKLSKIGWKEDSVVMTMDIRN